MQSKKPTVVPSSGKIIKRRGRQAVKKGSTVNENVNFLQNSRVMNSSLEGNWPHCQMSSEFEPYFFEVAESESVKCTPAHPGVVRHQFPSHLQSSPDFFAACSAFNRDDARCGSNTTSPGFNNTNYRMNSSRAQFHALCESYFHFYCVQGNPVTASSVNFMINQMCEVQSYMSEGNMIHRVFSNNQKTGLQSNVTTLGNDSITDRQEVPLANRSSDPVVRAEVILDFDKNTFGELEKIMGDCMDVLDPTSFEIPLTDNDFFMSEFVTAD